MLATPLVHQFDSRSGSTFIGCNSPITFQYQNPPTHCYHSTLGGTGVSTTSSSRSRRSNQSQTLSCCCHPGQRPQPLGQRIPSNVGGCGRGISTTASPGQDMFSKPRTAPSPPSAIPTLKRQKPMEFKPGRNAGLAVPVREQEQVQKKAKRSTSPIAEDKGRLVSFHPLSSLRTSTHSRSSSTSSSRKPSLSQSHKKSNSSSFEYTSFLPIPAPTPPVAPPPAEIHDTQMHDSPMYDATPLPPTPKPKPKSKSKSPSPPPPAKPLLRAKSLPPSPPPRVSLPLPPLSPPRPSPEPLASPQATQPTPAQPQPQPRRQRSAAVPLLKKVILRRFLATEHGREIRRRGAHAGVLYLQTLAAARAFVVEFAASPMHTLDYPYSPSYTDPTSPAAPRKDLDFEYVHY